jgi:hypothetical protein
MRRAAVWRHTIPGVEPEDDGKRRTFAATVAYLDAYGVEPGHDVERLAEHGSPTSPALMIAPMRFNPPAAN